MKKIIVIVVVIAGLFFLIHLLIRNESRGIPPSGNSLLAMESILPENVNIEPKTNEPEPLGNSKSERPGDDLRVIASRIEDQEYVDRAVSIIGRHFRAVPKNIVPRVERINNYIQVFWPVPASTTDKPNPPGPDIYFRVVFKDNDPDFMPQVTVGG